jgi:hypothetical protein
VYLSLEVPSQPLRYSPVAGLDDNAIAVVNTAVFGEEQRGFLECACTSNFDVFLRPWSL